MECGETQMSTGGGGGGRSVVEGAERNAIIAGGRHERSLIIG